MTALVIDRQELPEPFLSYIDANRVVRAERDADSIVFTPAAETDELGCGVNPDDFDNDTDYINAVPGLADKILAARNAPASERERVPRELFHV